MIDILDKLGKAIYDCHDNMLAMRSHPDIGKREYIDLDEPNKYMVAGPFSFMTDIIIQLYGIVDDHECNQYNFDKRLAKLEKAVKQVNKVKKLSK